MGADVTPPPGSAQIETRLLLVAEMLDRAVEEVHRVMAEIKNRPDYPPPGSDRVETNEARSTDGNT